MSDSEHSVFQVVLALFTPFLMAVTFGLFLPACVSGQYGNTASWWLSLKTSGGLTGRGTGNILISSDGNVRYEKPAVAAQPGSVCEGMLSASELRRLSEAVKASRPGEWRMGRPRVAAPDAFTYRLELKAEGGQTHRVEWDDNTFGDLPDGLRGLSEAVQAVMRERSKQC